ncbi:hypothetical protein HMPREF0972_00090 [Actinomyces sp. oral taxon 848 str. F0332]|nr:hypothetical protein HMPREF0972_00090 [Actinomyces sp. oral taxon 848 str. F0332]
MLHFLPAFALSLCSAAANGRGSRSAFGREGPPGRRRSGRLRAAPRMGP